MKYLICSDIHRRMDSFRKALCEAVSKELGGVIIAGDLEVSSSEINDIIYKTCAKVCNPKVYMVKGNCDYSSDLQNELTFILPGGISCLLTHGHKYQVKMNTTILSYAAESMGCKVAIYGHTHVMDDSYVGSVRVINPGSIGASYSGSGSFMIMDVDDGIITIERKFL